MVTRSFTSFRTFNSFNTSTTFTFQRYPFMTKPKIANANVFALERNPNQDELKTTTEHCLSQSTIGASTTKVMNFNGIINNDNISLEYAKEILEKAFKDIANGDLSIVEQMLLGQAFALNMAVNSLAVRATRQKDVSTMQMLMNLSFKAQNQSRATLDSLIQLKQPSQTTFVKQANIANGHQQVNNFDEKNLTPQNELLKDSHAQLDTRGTPTTKGIDTALEALGKVDRGKNTGRKSKIIQECHKGRQEPRGARVN